MNWRSAFMGLLMLSCKWDKSQGDSDVKLQKGLATELRVAALSENIKRDACQANVFLFYVGNAESFGETVFLEKPEGFNATEKDEISKYEDKTFTNQIMSQAEALENIFDPSKLGEDQAKNAREEEEACANLRTADKGQYYVTTVTDGPGQDDSRIRTSHFVWKDGKWNLKSRKLWSFDPATQHIVEEQKERPWEINLPRALNDVIKQTYENAKQEMNSVTLAIYVIKTHGGRVRQAPDGITPNDATASVASKPQVMLFDAHGPMGETLRSDIFMPFWKKDHYCRVLESAGKKTLTKEQIETCIPKGSVAGGEGGKDGVAGGGGKDGVAGGGGKDGIAGGGGKDGIAGGGGKDGIAGGGGKDGIAGGGGKDGIAGGGGKDGIAGTEEGPKSATAEIGGKEFRVGGVSFEHAVAAINSGKTAGTKATMFIGGSPDSGTKLRDALVARFEAMAKQKDGPDGARLLGEAMTLEPPGQLTAHGVTRIKLIEGESTRSFIILDSCYGKSAVARTLQKFNGKRRGMKAVVLFNEKPLYYQLFDYTWFSPAQYAAIPTLADEIYSKEKSNYTEDDKSMLTALGQKLNELTTEFIEKKEDVINEFRIPGSDPNANPF